MAQLLGRQVDRHPDVVDAAILQAAQLAAGFPEDPVAQGAG